MARRPATITTNGHNSTVWPGAYEHALRKICERDADIAAPDFLTLADEDVEAWELGIAAHVAALIAARNGQPVRVQSYMLPDGMPSPLFDRFPRNGISRGSFTITPDDRVTLRPRLFTGGVNHE
jgi:hypothetical protein